MKEKKVILLRRKLRQSNITPENAEKEDMYLSL